MPTPPVSSPRNIRDRTCRHRLPRRAFQPIRIAEVGYQPGADLDSDDPVAVVPPLQLWRNNLAVLSARYNLYFVAREDHLHVYETLFPSQELRPLVVIPLPDSGSDIDGALAAHSSSADHAVNNLIVSNLGADEVIVCACDDGDVLAYSTRAFREYAARSKAVYAYDADRVDLAVRPFFHNNVGGSAWGLSVHTAARLIAVSCNNHEVTVFAFALQSFSKPKIRQPIATDVDDDDKGEDEDEDDDDDEYVDEHGWLTFDGQTSVSWLDQWQDQLRSRRKNAKLVLRDGHESNIPSVAFCNTPEDPGGHFLVSTDITGVTILWNIWHTMIWRVLVPDEREFDEFDRRRSGWSTIWIDTRAFTKIAPDDNPWRGKEQTKDKKDGPFVVNISDSRRYVSNVGRWPISARMAHPRPVARPTGIDQAEDMAGVGILSGSQTPVFATDENSDNDAVDDRAAIESGEVSDNGEGSEDDGGVSLTDNTHHRQPDRLHQVWDEIVNALTEHNEVDAGSDGEAPTDPRSRIWGVSVHEFNCRFWPMLTITCQEARRLRSDIRLRYPEPEAPFLHVMPRALHLFQSVRFHGSKESNKDRPVIFFDDPLQQDMDDGWQRSFENCDRMNMHVQIPELGVVLLGSPKGRVAVLTLHREDHNRWSPKSNKPLYSFRLNWLLPLHSSELTGRRPMSYLAGLSAAPVQGYEVRKGRRPWKVLLLYANGTVISYEIGGVEWVGPHSGRLI